MPVKLPVVPAIHFAGYLGGFANAGEKLCQLQVRPLDGRAGFDCAHPGDCAFKPTRNRSICLLAPKEACETIQK